MRATHFFCAIAMCAPLVLEAGAAELPAQDSTPVGDAGRSAGPASREPHRNREAGRSESSGTDSGKGMAANRQGGGSAVTPPRGAIDARRGGVQLDRSNADRVRSLLHKQPPRSVARTTATGGPVASKRAVPTATGAGTRGPASPVVAAGPLAPARLSPLRAALRSSPSHAAPGRGSSIGGASITNPGRIGGSPTGRAASPGAIDGTQVHRSARGH
jgi:hypothetical protein